MLLPVYHQFYAFQWESVPQPKDRIFNHSGQHLFKWYFLITGCKHRHRYFIILFIKCKRIDAPENVTDYFRGSFGLSSWFKTEYLLK